MPNPLYTKTLADNVESASKKVQEEIVNHNTFSELYRATVKSIDEKVILLSAGSISLSLTFVGILFNSTRDVSRLDYTFLILSITVWLISIVTLLLSRWIEATYLATSVHGHYLNALERKTKAEIEFYKAYPNIISSDTLQRFTDQELDRVIKDGEDHYKLVNDSVKKYSEKESLYEKLHKGFRLSGHILFVAGYCLAFMFFLGVIRVMSS